MRSLNNKINYSEFTFNIRKSSPFASLSLNGSRNPSPSEFFVIPVKEFAQGSDKSPISPDIKNKIGQDTSAELSHAGSRVRAGQTSQGAQALLFLAKSPMNNL